MTFCVRGGLDRRRTFSKSYCTGKNLLQQEQVPLQSKKVLDFGMFGWTWVLKSIYGAVDFGCSRSTISQIVCRSLSQGDYSQTYQTIWPDMSGYIARHIKLYSQTYRAIWPDISGYTITSHLISRFFVNAGKLAIIAKLNNYPSIWLRSVQPVNGSLKRLETVAKPIS